MKKRWTIREAALITLPVVALAAYGWWMNRPEASKRPAPRPDNPYKFTLKSVELLPATPRDVYEGFDTLVKVKYSSPALPPLPNARARESHDVNVLDPRIVYKSGANFHRVKPHNINASYQAHSDEATFRLNLSKVTINRGELIFKTALTKDYGYWLKGVAGAKGYSRVTSPPWPSSIIVRKAGENVSIPPISKSRPFVLRSIKPDPSPFDKIETRLKLTFERFHPSSRDRWNYARPRLVDAHGKEYDYEQPPGKQGFPWARMS